jgi:hypothetical protein
MSTPKRYHDISREQRIADSDKVAVDALESELRKVIRQKHGVKIEQGDLSKAIEVWLEKHKIKSKLKKAKPK